MSNRMLLRNKDQRLTTNQKQMLQRKQIEITIHIRLQCRNYISYLMGVNVWFSKMSSFNPAVAENGMVDVPSYSHNSATRYILLK